MAPISALRYPKKSHRKAVRLPEDSAELAEFFGIMIGDGGINNSWQANITLNSVADAQYVGYVSSLIENLFCAKAAVWKNKKRQAIRLILSSVAVVDFITQKGLKRGDKLKGGLEIPSWIIANKSYRLACVRGLMDTDGCLYIHRHSVSGKEYRNIGLCFCSYSSTIIKQVAGIFEEFGIIPHISNHGRSIYLYKADAVAKYLEIFGTSNQRISSIYQDWRRLIAV